MMPDPAQIEAMLAERQEHAEAHNQLAIAQRREILYWAAIMCICSPRYARGEFSVAGCPVHSEFMILPDGTLL
jgi:uncharacterized membrane-anchored protein